jgi:WD40 repeat protein
MNCNESFFLVWEGVSDKKDNLKAYDTELGAVTCIEASENKLFVGTKLGAIKVYHNVELTAIFEMKEHFKPITALKAFGGILASASEDLTIILWKEETAQNMKRIVTDVVLLHLEVDTLANLLIGFNHSNELRGYDYSTGV